jgi:PAS domain S-box-containing protein
MKNDARERQPTGGRGAAAEALARLALDHAVEAIVVCDEHGGVVRANQAALRLCDGNPLLRPFADAFPLRAGAGGALSLARVLQGESLSEGDAALDRSGQPFALHVTAGPILEGHRVLGCVVVLTDISKCKQEVVSLVASEIRYRRLFESARDGILILDAETGIIVDVNPYLIELLGFTRAEVVDKRLWELGTFNDSRVSEAKFRELQQAGYARYDDMALETSVGGRAEVEFVSNVYLVNGQRVIQCNVRDVSERKRAEALAAKHLEELERWQDVMLGREDRVQELKREVNDLCRGAGVAARYPSQDVDSALRTE